MIEFGNVVMTELGDRIHTRDRYLPVVGLVRQIVIDTPKTDVPRETLPPASP